MLCAVVPPPPGVESADMLRCTHHQEVTLSRPATATRARHFTNNTHSVLHNRMADFIVLHNSIGSTSMNNEFGIDVGTDVGLRHSLVIELKLFSVGR